MRSNLPDNLDGDLVLQLEEFVDPELIFLRPQNRGAGYIEEFDPQPTRGPDLKTRPDTRYCTPSFSPTSMGSICAGGRHGRAAGYNQ